MVEAQTTLEINTETALPSYAKLEETLGHFFIGRLVDDFEDVLFVTTDKPYTDGVRFMVIHPTSLTGLSFGYESLSPYVYRPVTDITYNVTVGS